MGFDAMCYTRYSLPDGTIKVSFVMAGNRVAPLKQLSLPCLELQVAVLDVRLYCVVKQELTVVIKDTIFWSDSKTVLQYTADKSRHFHTFMANRVSEIHDATDPTQGRHVSGHCNPAGNCTWGLGAANLDHNCWWLNGPAFLTKSVEYWPQDMLDPSLKMRKWKTKWSGHTSVSNTRAYFPDPEKFSSWTRFCRVLVWICRFVKSCKRKAEDHVASSLTATEIHRHMKKSETYFILTLKP